MSGPAMAVNYHRVASGWYRPEEEEESDGIIGVVHRDTRDVVAGIPVFARRSPPVPVESCRHKQWLGRSRPEERSASPDGDGDGLSTIEPYPVPEQPSLLLLEPLLLVHSLAEGDGDGERGRRRRKGQLSPSEQQRLARIMVGYTLAFFLLAILTFYVVYFV